MVNIHCGSRLRVKCNQFLFLLTIIWIILHFLSRDTVPSILTITISYLAVGPSLYFLDRDMVIRYYINTLWEEQPSLEDREVSNPAIVCLAGA